MARSGESSTLELWVWKHYLYFSNSINVSKTMIRQFAYHKAVGKQTLAASRLFDNLIALYSSVSHSCSRFFQHPPNSQFLPTCGPRINSYLWVTALFFDLALTYPLILSWNLASSWHLSLTFGGCAFDTPMAPGSILITTFLDMRTSTHYENSDLCFTVSV